MEISIVPLSSSNILLYAGLIWNRVAFWTGHRLEETYYSKLGTTYFRLGFYKHAITMFLKSEKAHSGRDFEYAKYNRYYLGYCYLNLGDFKSASEHFAYVYKYEPNDYKTASSLARCYTLIADPEAALKVLQQISANLPAAPKPYVDSATILSELGRKEEALRCLETAESKYHDSNLHAIVHAMSYAIRGDFANATALLKEAYSKIDFESEYRPGYESFYPKLFLREDLQILLAQWQRKSGDIYGARLTMETAYEVNKDDVWILNDLATTYAEQNLKLEEALKLADRALTSQPENSFFLDTKAWILFKMGEKALAKQLIEKSRNLNPNYLEIQNRYRDIMQSS
jgi:Flp pilus assembly protein TadD